MPAAANPSCMLLAACSGADEAESHTRVAHAGAKAGFGALLKQVWPGYGAISQCDWWARQDSNPRPSRYERPALTAELQAPTIALSPHEARSAPLEHRAKMGEPVFRWKRCDNKK